MGPEVESGQVPCRLWYSSAHRRISGTVIGARPCGLRTPRCRASMRASEDPPGSPRLPDLRAESSNPQFSPGASGSGPDFDVGQRPFLSVECVGPGENQRKRSAVEHSLDS